MDYFKYRSPNSSKLRAYGFTEEGGALVYQTEILEGQFRLTVKVQKGVVSTLLLDSFTDEPYTLHLVETAAGAFVGSVREAYGKVLEEISLRCFEKEIFQSEQARALITHVREKYGDELEYLWEKFPDNAIWRRGDNQKWYGLLLTVQRKKLGLEGEGSVEILDVRMDPEELKLLLDGKKYLPGWHMNKKHWLAVPLDGTLSLEEVFSLLEESWHLAK